MNIEDWLAHWGLSRPEKIATTKTSDVFKVFQEEKPFVLKVLNKNGQIYEKDSVPALKFFNGCGAVKLIDFHKVALLLEYIDGVKLSEFVATDGDQSASEVICKTLGKLHSKIEYAEDSLPSLQENFSSLISRGEKEPETSIYYKTMMVAKKLLNNPMEKIVVLHGDIHHDNILYSAERGWLVIDPQPLIGERTFDFANSFFNPDDCPEIVESEKRILSLADQYSKHTGIDEKRILEFAYAHGGLSMSWQLDDGEEPSRRMRITKMIENILGA